MKNILLPISVQIGKKGLTPEVIEKIKEQLKKKRLVKIKMLPSFIRGKDKEAVIQELAEKTNSKIFQRVGFTIVLKRVK